MAGDKSEVLQCTLMVLKTLVSMGGGRKRLQTEEQDGERISAVVSRVLHVAERG